MKGGFVCFPAVLSWLLLSLAIFPVFGALSGPLIGEFNEENEEVERQRAEQRRADTRQLAARGAPPWKEAEGTRSASTQRLASNFWDEFRRNLRNDLGRQRQYQRRQYQYQYQDERRQQAIEQRRLEAEQRWQEREWYREQSRLELEQRRQAEAERERQAAAEAARLADQARQQAVREAKQRAEVARLAVETQRAEAERLALEAKKAEAERFRREAEAAKRAEVERIRWEQEQRERQAATLREQERRAASARGEEALRKLENLQWGRALVLFLPLLTGTSFGLLLLPSYRFFTEYHLTHFTNEKHTVTLLVSAVAFIGFLAMLLAGYALVYPVGFLLFWIGALPAIFFLPGAVFLVAQFIDTLIQPYPFDVEIRRATRYKHLDEEQVARIDAAMYNPLRDGFLSGWKAKIHARRMEELARLLRQQGVIGDEVMESLLRKNHVKN